MENPHQPFEPGSPERGGNLHPKETIQECARHITALLQELEGEKSPEQALTLRHELQLWQQKKAAAEAALEADPLHVLTEDDEEDTDDGVGETGEPRTLH